MEGIKNFVEFIVENWTSIVVVLCVIFLIVARVVSFFRKSKEERVEIVKAQLRQGILKLVTDAEIDYLDWTKAGAIKRSQVIQQIYADYPVLEKFADQDGLIDWIDKMIDEALRTVRAVVEQSTTVTE